MHRRQRHHVHERRAVAAVVGEPHVARALRAGLVLERASPFRATITVGSRSVVLTTYHNIGMIDWAELFWGWLEAVGIPKFLLLELDGVTCEAARLLNCSLAFECATAADLGLPKEYTEIRKAGAVQEWGTDANSAYFKFLRWKLRMVEVVADQGVDVIMADADVLILTPQFITELAAAPYDLSISSDARHCTSTSLSSILMRPSMISCFTNVS